MRSTGQSAAIHIRRLIFDGTLRPGDRIPQDEVAAALGVSRIPVREGIVALEGEGWVRLVPNRGAFVNRLDEHTVRDHYELYGIIYGFAAKRATDRSGPDLVDRLAELAAQMGRTDEPRPFTALVFEFHRAIVVAARSPRVEVVLRNLSSIVPGNFFELVPAAKAQERKGAKAIVRAMRRGDGDEAALDYQRSMRRMGDEVVRLLRERGLFEP